MLFSFCLRFDFKLFDENVLLHFEGILLKIENLDFDQVPLFLLKLKTIESYFRKTKVTDRF